MAGRTPLLRLGGRSSSMPSSFGRSMSVETLLCELLPQCSQQILERLGQEGIAMAEQLAGMDKEDLREVGFNMAERNRILQWAANLNGNSERRDDFEQEQMGDDIGSFPSLSSMHSRWLGPGTPSLRDVQRTGSNRTIIQSAVNDFGMAAGHDELDELETQEEFWCRCAQTDNTLSRQVSQAAAEDDVRENLLEQQFDCTFERIREVFRSVMSNAGTSDSSLAELNEGPNRCMAELNEGLQRFGIHGMGDSTLEEIIRKFTGYPLRSLKLHEFESVLTRLKLASLIEGPLSSSGSPRADVERLVVCDYSATLKLKSVASGHFQDSGQMPQNIFKTITASHMKQFFFGHRPKTSKSEHPVVRWVHMSSFERELLLALTVKYTLHPLGVEDVFEQCPSKIDRYGCHYFIAIELLTLVETNTGTSAPSGKEMVVVDGRHVTVFCAGPPLIDTVISIDQAQNTFAEEWPRPLDKESSRMSSATSPAGARSNWLDKLRARFKAGRSRLCERRADFLVYTIVDVCTDEILRVTRAFVARVSYIEGELRRWQAELRGHNPGSRPELPHEIFGEAAQAQLQLAVVARRVKSLRSMVKRILKDTQFCSAETSNYWADCEDHLDDAYDDAVQCGERCAALMKAFERALDKLQEQERQESQEQWRRKQWKDEQQGERLNKILFVMTVGELCFAPVQFMAGVYGMNFVDNDGNPTMPELLNPNGYSLFWKGVVTYLVLAICITICIYQRLVRAPNVEIQEDVEILRHASWQLPPWLQRRSSDRQDGRYVALSAGDDEGELIRSPS